MTHFTRRTMIKAAITATLSACLPALAAPLPEGVATRIEHSVQGHPPHIQVETPAGEVWRIFDNGITRRVVRR